MKKFILLFVFALSLAFVGTAATQAPAKKTPVKTEQTAAKPAEVAKAKPAEMSKNKKMVMKKGTAKKVTPTPEKKTM